MPWFEYIDFWENWAIYHGYFFVAFTVLLTVAVIVFGVLLHVLLSKMPGIRQSAVTKVCLFRSLFWVICLVSLFVVCLVVSLIGCSLLDSALLFCSFALKVWYVC